MNRFKMEFEALSENEALARICVAAFVAGLDPTLEEINDVKTAVSEAVTNCIIHGYGNRGGTVVMEGMIEDNELTVKISDTGRGIADVVQAMEPLYTTGSPMERSGMGFTFMDVFMDSLSVESKLGEGTIVIMKKRFGQSEK